MSDAGVVEQAQKQETGVQTQSFDDLVAHLVEQMRQYEQQQAPKGAEGRAAEQQLAQERARTEKPVEDQAADALKKAKVLLKPEENTVKESAVEILHSMQAQQLVKELTKLQEKMQTRADISEDLKREVSQNIALLYKKIEQTPLPSLTEEARREVNVGDSTGEATPLVGLAVALLGKEEAEKMGITQGATLNDLLKGAQVLAHEKHLSPDQALHLQKFGRLMRESSIYLAAQHFAQADPTYLETLTNMYNTGVLIESLGGTVETIDPAALQDPKKQAELFIFLRTGKDATTEEIPQRFAPRPGESDEEYKVRLMGKDNKRLVLLSYLLFQNLKQGGKARENIIEVAGGGVREVVAKRGEQKVYREAKLPKSVQEDPFFKELFGESFDTTSAYLGDIAEQALRILAEKEPNATLERKLEVITRLVSHYKGVEGKTLLEHHKVSQLYTDGDAPVVCVGTVFLEASVLKQVTALLGEDLILAANDVPRMVEGVWEGHVQLVVISKKDNRVFIVDPTEEIANRRITEIVDAKRKADYLGKYASSNAASQDEQTSRNLISDMLYNLGRKEGNIDTWPEYFKAAQRSNEEGFFILLEKARLEKNEVARNHYKVQLLTYLKMANPEFFEGFTPAQINARLESLLFAPSLEIKARQFPRSVRNYEFSSSKQVEVYILESLGEKLESEDPDLVRDLQAKIRALAETDGSVDANKYKMYEVELLLKAIGKIFNELHEQPEQDPTKKAQLNYTQHPEYIKLMAERYNLLLGLKIKALQNTHTATFDISSANTTLAARSRAVIVGLQRKQDRIKLYAGGDKGRLHAYEMKTWTSDVESYFQQLLGIMGTKQFQYKDTNLYLSDPIIAEAINGTYELMQTEIRKGEKPNAAVSGRVDALIKARLKALTFEEFYFKKGNRIADLVIPVGNGPDLHIPQFEDVEAVRIATYDKWEQDNGAKIGGYFRSMFFQPARQGAKADIGETAGQQYSKIQQGGVAEAINPFMNIKKMVAVTEASETLLKLLDTDDIMKSFYTIYFNNWVVVRESKTRNALAFGTTDFDLFMQLRACKSYEGLEQARRSKDKEALNDFYMAKEEILDLIARFEATSLLKDTYIKEEVFYELLSLTRGRNAPGRSREQILRDREADLADFYLLDEITNVLRQFEIERVASEIDGEDGKGFDEKYAKQPNKEYVERDGNGNIIRVHKNINRSRKSLEDLMGTIAGGAPLSAAGLDVEQKQMLVFLASKGLFRPGQKNMGGHMVPATPSDDEYFNSANGASLVSLTRRSAGGPITNPTTSLGDLIKLNQALGDFISKGEHRPPTYVAITDFQGKQHRHVIETVKHHIIYNERYYGDIVARTNFDMITEVDVPHNLYQSMVKKVEVYREHHEIWDDRVGHSGTEVFKMDMNDLAGHNYLTSVTKYIEDAYKTKKLIAAFVETPSMENLIKLGSEGFGWMDNDPNEKQRVIGKFYMARARFVAHTLISYKAKESAQKIPVIGKGLSKVVDGINRITNFTIWPRSESKRLLGYQGEQLDLQYLMREIQELQKKNLISDAVAKNLRRQLEFVGLLRGLPMVQLLLSAIIFGTLSQLTDVLGGK